ncbi:BLUF domain-containing protein [Gilvimarinus sp. SDUM040013]|uniref:BLUF domain-containing protein n=1 Tax=Gilvimarinus gilvus TaxID=3058038 RepID=A0ABU4RZK0_9GAMM|nr:BLUF domain-containing protein [Gilvimarinus sp. SDUM040013]MDO3386125.1 BLUF domain-containing protein [Gilvimarinus sp. SDUM040013]MDX6850334.1 BLUF domain-containing protein [Gilvimarinus sp. SDUM040013]
MDKRIACLCTIKPSDTNTSHSEQVFSIFDSARIHNKENGIVGAFLVADDTLMQILEGESSALANVLYRVNRDPRIADVSVIVNINIEKRAFSRWSLKLLSEQCAPHVEYLQKVHQLIHEDASFTSNLDTIRYHKIFFHTDNTRSTAPLENTEKSGFEGTLLSMTSWPRPTQLRLTAELMKVCQLLIGHTVEYQRLVTLAIFNSRGELDSCLEKLQEVNAVSVIKAKEPNNLHSIETHQKRKQTSTGGSRFSQALKQFISGQGIKGGHRQ